jgi:hypothetical protein
VRHAVDEAFVLGALLFELPVGGGQFCDAAFELTRQPLDPFLVGFTFADVARDLGKATQRPAGIAQRGDDDVGIEVCAVPADAPSFVLETPDPNRLGVLVLGPLSFDGVGCLEHRNVPSDVLVGSITLDALGAGIPAGDHALGVEEKDRVVDGAVHQQPQRVGIWRDCVGRDGPSSRLIHTTPSGQVRNLKYAGEARRREAQRPATPA